MVKHFFIFFILFFRFSYLLNFYFLVLINWELSLFLAILLLSQNVVPLQSYKIRMILLLFSYFYFSPFGFFVPEYTIYLPWQVRLHKVHNKKKLQFLLIHLRVVLDYDLYMIGFLPLCNSNFFFTWICCMKIFWMFGDNKIIIFSMNKKGRYECTFYMWDWIKFLNIEIMLKYCSIYFFFYGRFDKWESYSAKNRKPSAMLIS